MGAMRICLHRGAVQHAGHAGGRQGHIHMPVALALCSRRLLSQFALAVCSRSLLSQFALAVWSHCAARDQKILASCSLAASAELQMKLQFFVACKMIVEMHTTIQQNRMWCFCLLSTSALAAIELPSLFFSCTLPLRQVTCGTNGLWSLDRHRNSIHKACKRHSIHNACIACVTLI